MSGQDELNPALWLATQAGKMELSCLLRTSLWSVLRQKIFFWKPYNKSFIDQASMGDKSVETLGSKIRFLGVLVTFPPLPPKTMLIFLFLWLHRLQRLHNIEVGSRIVGIQFIVLPFGSLQLEDPFYSTTYKACWLILGYLKYVWLFSVGLVIPWRSQPNWRTRLFLLFGTSLCRRIRQGLTCQKPEASTGISLGNKMPHNVLPLVLCPVLASGDVFNFGFP